MRFAHSHSAIQLLPHFPWHWNSIILPPQCGQTKLMIEEMMLALDSPGIASMILMLSSRVVAFCKPDANYEIRETAGKQNNCQRVGVAFSEPLTSIWQVTGTSVLC